MPVHSPIYPTGTGRADSRLIAAYPIQRFSYFCSPFIFYGGLAQLVPTCVGTLAWTLAWQVAVLVLFVLFIGGLDQLVPTHVGTLAWQVAVLVLYVLFIGGLAQLARALAWHARGHRFDSDILHQTLRKIEGFFYLCPSSFTYSSRKRKTVTTSGKRKT
ncbi:MAG: hypothetical protein FD123_492 [Bacteroidetes bacterium]|nr:MAG: hypothetical protein FD123_492 [Bacteroidota bacterium]